MARADVLVVEDQPLAAKDVEATLSVMDYDVVEIVRKGEDAIETAVEAEPEVVLMDILLAGEMDGIEAAQQIQDEHEIPVVFLTAHAEPETVGRAKQFGPYGYISKPVDPVELRTAIEVAIHKSELDEELKRSRIELTAFAHTVAHHLGEPLAAIDDRLDRVRVGIRGIDGCTAHRVDATKATTIVGEYWSDESMDYGDLEQVLRTRGLVAGRTR